MKKRNWTLICLAAGIACFGAFGVYNGIARSKGSFELEDISGDRAHLADFPLEGYAGDNRNTVEFTIMDGKLEKKHHSYDIDAMENIRIAREIGKSEFAAYFSHMWREEGSAANTEAVPSKDAKLKHEDVPSIDKFEIYHMNNYMNNYRYGETITADKTDIYVTIYQTRKDKSMRTHSRGVARFPSGLTLTEPILFTYGNTAENRNGNEEQMDSYTHGFVGEEYGIRMLKSYSAEVGDTVYAVVAPDARCEGKTYIYQVKTEENNMGTAYQEPSLEEYITDRWTTGKAEPFLPVPDPAERSIVGLQGIADRYLAVFLTEGDDFIAEIYDTEANFIGSARKTLRNVLEMSESRKNAEVTGYLRANRVDFFYVPWEDGVSLSLAVTDRATYMEADENEVSGYREDCYDDVAGRLLLWITPDGVEQSKYNGKGTNLAIHGDKILRLDTVIAPEKEKLTEIFRGYMPETMQIEVLDAKTLKPLYQGRLKNDFWQDTLTELAYMDNAGSGYAKVEQNYYHEMQSERAVAKLQPIGGRSGDRW